MKKQKVISILAAGAMGLLFSCSSKQNAEQCLNNEPLRKEIISGIAGNRSYMNEMMREMMSSDSAMNMMGSDMIGNMGMMKRMMGMMMENSMMREQMADSMMAACLRDTSVCRMMSWKMTDMGGKDSSTGKMMCSMIMENKNMMQNMHHMMHEKGMMNQMNENKTRQNK